MCSSHGAQNRTRQGLSVLGSNAHSTCPQHHFHDLEWLQQKRKRQGSNRKLAFDGKAYMTRDKQEPSTHETVHPELGG